MFELITQLIMPLVFAALIGFACGWLLQRQAVLKSCQECKEARQRLEEMTILLHAFRQEERILTQPASKLGAYEAELRMLENELEMMLGELKNTRSEIELNDARSLHYLFKQAL
jgi:hypothetical protein